MQNLQVGGFTPLTTIDYPGELAAVVFCQGCPWSCDYCHNQALQPRKSTQLIEWQQIIDFLQRRTKLLDAVVFSGGEPTLQNQLPQAIAQVKALGFKVGLHSAGCYPERLEKLLPLLDWVGLDIKAPKQAYDTLTGVKGSGDNAWLSAKAVINSGIKHQIRTTLAAQISSPGTQQKIVAELNKLGQVNHIFQPCNQ